MRKRRNVWTECVFVDPIGDLAVLDSPDAQELANKAHAYDRLMKAALPLQVSQLDSETANARLLPIEGPSFGCVVRAIKCGPLFIEKPEQKIESGMSGSPILAEDGSAIGVVVTDGDGPHPCLVWHLPGWLLAEVGLPFTHAHLSTIIEG